MGRESIDHYGRQCGGEMLELKKIYENAFGCEFYYNPVYGYITIKGKNRCIISSVYSVKKGDWLSKIRLPLKPFGREFNYLIRECVSVMNHWAGRIHNGDENFLNKYNFDTVFLEHESVQELKLKLELMGVDIEKPIFGGNLTEREILELYPSLFKEKI